MSTLVFAFATFHATTFLLVPLLLAYRGGGLGQTLQGLNTLVGLGLFVAVWVTTYIATSMAMRDLDLTSGLPVDGDKLMRRALVWGGVNGVMFLLVLLSGFATANAISRPENIVQGTLFLIAAMFPGGAIAFVIGALVGVVFAGIDLLLLGVAARLVPREARSSA